MNVQLLIAYLGTILILIATPGPVVALVVGTSSRAGAMAAISTALGANAASMLLIAAAAAVLAGSLAVSTQTLNVLALLGCLFIGWLGFRAWREPVAPAGEMVRKGGWWQGFLIGVTNPKDILFFVALFPQFIHITSSFGASIGVLAAVWLIVDLCVLVAYITLMRRALAQRQRVLIARLSAAVLLVIAACGVPYSLQALLAG